MGWYGGLARRSRASRGRSHAYQAFVVRFSPGSRIQSAR